MNRLHDELLAVGVPTRIYAPIRDQHESAVALKSLFAALFLVSGVLHFVKPAFYLKIMPPWMPFHRAAVFWSGVAEIVLGVALLIPETSSWAAWGLIALLVAVFPANIQMLINEWKTASLLYRGGLIIRLPLQGLLIYWAYAYV